MKHLQIPSPAEQALAGFRAEMKIFGQEVEQTFKSAQRMPLKDRVELLEHQMMQIMMLIDRRLTAAEGGAP